MLDDSEMCNNGKTITADWFGETDFGKQIKQWTL